MAVLVVERDHQVAPPKKVINCGVVHDGNVESAVIVTIQ